VNAYSRILRVPRLAPLLGASVLARLPIGINGLALVLFLREQRGAFAVAGAAAGGLALGAGVGAPIGARLVDRAGPRVLVALGAAHAAGLGALIALGGAGAPAGVIVAAAVATGIALPPTSSVMRALYPRLIGPAELVQGAYALDSVLTETIFIIGPLITAALVALVAPAAALAVSGVAVLAGAAAFVAALPGGAVERRAGHARNGPLGALRSPGIRTLVLAMLPIGMAIGAVEVAVPAYSEAQGHRELAGLLVAIWSLGSAAGGLVYGARPRRGSLARVHVQVALLIPLGLVCPALAGAPATMALLIIPAGVFIAPLLATRNELAGIVAPAGSETEAYTWPLTALVAGVSLGAGAAGAISDAYGWRTAILAGAATSALGGVAAALRRETLAPAGEPIAA
jgi:MFS family permease